MGANDPYRILVVDDSRQITDTLVLILRSAGYMAIGVYSAAEARSDFVDFKPDLVLADVVLGDGNGLDLAVEFRQKYPDCRILLFSGQVTSEDLRRMSPEGGNFQLLDKPVDPQFLVKFLANAFDHSVVASA